MYFINAFLENVVETFHNRHYNPRNCFEIPHSPTMWRVQNNFSYECGSINRYGTASLHNSGSAPSNKAIVTQLKYRIAWDQAQRTALMCIGFVRKMSLVFVLLMTVENFPFCLLSLLPQSAYSNKFYPTSAVSPQFRVRRIKFT